MSILTVFGFENREEFRLVSVEMVHPLTSFENNEISPENRVLLVLLTDVVKMENYYILELFIAGLMVQKISTRLTTEIESDHLFASDHVSHVSHRFTCKNVVIKVQAHKRIVKHETAS